jgi:CelD/BcsL family acetyltransferase involved in cellulose biosynthesis
LEEIDDYAALDALSNIWDSVVQKSKENNVFSTWEWLSCWWQHFGQGRQLRVLVARERDQIIGIAPLMLSKYSFKRLGSACKLEFIGSPESGCNNLILTRSQEQCSKLFLDHIMSSTDWDLLELDAIYEDSSTLELLAKKTSGLQLGLTTPPLSPYIELPDSIERVMKRLGPETRRKLLRMNRKLREEYAVDAKTEADFTSVDEVMDIVFELKKKRCEQKKWPVPEKTERDFHSALARSLRNKGWLSVFFLTADDEPIACDYSFQYGSRRYGYHLSFDPAFSRYSVGSIALMHTIEMSIRRGLKEYDLRPGDVQYKLRWATCVRRVYQTRFVRRKLALRLWEYAKRNRMLGPILAYLGLERMYIK